MENKEPRQISGKQLAVLFAMVVVIALLGVVLVKPPFVVPRAAAAPEYELVSQNEKVVSNESLRGKVVLYDFIYTHCETVCPAMTGEMLKVQRALEAEGLLGDDVVLVTITFDPERDTPARLTEYAANVHADEDSWLWLTGDLIEIKELVGGEFGVYFEKIGAMEDHTEHGAGISSESGGVIDTDSDTAHEVDDVNIASYDFVHAAVFVLVDGDGTIRAEYENLLALDDVMRDMKMVLREEHTSGLMRPLYEFGHFIKAYP